VRRVQQGEPASGHRFPAGIGEVAGERERVGEPFPSAAEVSVDAIEFGGERVGPGLECQPLLLIHELERQRERTARVLVGATQQV
jgi:hypothetical protein